MSVTLKDVAALAGVSPSTASRVCKNHPSISRETKEKVRKAMEQLGYEPSVQSAGPEAVSRTIGIILPPSPKSGKRRYGARICGRIISPQTRKEGNT